MDGYSANLLSHTNPVCSSLRTNSPTNAMHERAIAARNPLLLLVAIVADVLAVLADAAQVPIQPLFCRIGKVPSGARVLRRTALVERSVHGLIGTVFGGVIVRGMAAFFVVHGEM